MRSWNNVDSVIDGNMYMAAQTCSNLKDFEFS